MKDPNFRYFHYYLKLQAIFLVFLSFIPLVFLLWKRKFYVAMFMVTTLVGINFLALEERSLFYIEPLLLAMMNLLMWLYFFIAEKKKISRFWIVLSAFLFALTISLKFSALFIIVLVAVMIITKFKTLEQRLSAIALLILSSLLFFCLINWNIFYSKEVFNAALHDYFSNFWHYATGHRGHLVENFKLNNLKKAISEIFFSLGGLVFLWPVILFFGLKWGSKKMKTIWISFTAVIILSLYLIVKQQIYVDRNILPFLTAIVLITGVMLDQIVRHLAENSSFTKKLNPRYLYVLLAVLIVLPIWSFSTNYFKRIFPNAKSNIVEVIKRIDDQENRRLVTIDYSINDHIEGFASKEALPSAMTTNGDNFREFVRSTTQKFDSQDVVLVSEVGNNKQLTTYLLPSIFNTNLQYDTYFVYYNKADMEVTDQGIIGDFNHASAKSVFKDALLIRDDLVLREVKIRKGARIYLKFDFLEAKTNDWIGCRFYFHGKAYEEDVEQLPENRIEHGFEGWDFTISEENAIKYGNSMYVTHDFSPRLGKYEEFSLGIFRGCTKSKEFKLKNVVLPK